MSFRFIQIFLNLFSIQERELFLLSVNLRTEGYFNYININIIMLTNFINRKGKIICYLTDLIT